MNTEFGHFPGNQQQAEGNENKSASSEEAVQISLPRTDRPEGPFEHSGEVSNWTKEEEAEKKDQEQ